MGPLLLFWLAMMGLIQSKHFNCEYKGQCTGGTLNCLSGEECTVKCWDTDACTSTTVNCPTNANCDISCDTWHLPACQYIKVNCPTTGNCNMDCAELDTCLFAEVTWSPEPYLNTLDCGTSNIGCSEGFTVPPTIRPTSVTQTPTTATSNPTAAPSSVPSSAPTRAPSPASTAAPTTPSPSEPGTISCDAVEVGDYNDQALSFTIRMTFLGDLTFDASNSDFTIKSMSAVFFPKVPQSALPVDGVLTLRDLEIVGEYIFT
eukprot:610285_1